METALGTKFLYAAHKVHATFRNKYGTGEISSTSTAFNVRNDVGQQFAVTNRHCVDAPYKDNRYDGYQLEELYIEHHIPRDGNVNSFPVVTKALTLDVAGVSVHPNSTIDLAVVPIPATSIPSPAFTVPASLIPEESAIHGLVWAGETVFFPGFPAWYDKQGARPVFRTGHIVSDPRNDYRREYGESRKGDGDAQIAFEAMSFDGNSGSPVFLPQRGFPPGGDIEWTIPYRPLMLIGINAGHQKMGTGDHSGLSFMYKSSCLHDLIRTA